MVIGDRCTERTDNRRVLIGTIHVIYVSYSANFSDGRDNNSIPFLGCWKIIKISESMK